MYVQVSGNKLLVQENTKRKKKLNTPSKTTPSRFVDDFSNKEYDESSKIEEFIEELQTLLPDVVASL